MKNRKRTKQLHFMVDEAEREIINKKMAILGTDNLGAFLRRMAVYGYMIEVDMQPLNQLTTQLNRIGNNVNQLAKRANETGNIYCDDIEKVGADIAEIKAFLKEFTQHIFDEMA